MFSCTYCKNLTPYLHNLKSHVKNIHDKSNYAPLKRGAGSAVPMEQTIPYHSQNVKLSNQKAPTNNLLRPGAAYTSTAIPQHLTSYQVRQPVQNGSGVLHNTQQYDPRAIPQIQYNGRTWSSTSYRLLSKTRNSRWIRCFTYHSTI